jgi:hypothetical protein
MGFIIRLHVHPSFFHTERLALIVTRRWKKIPDPFLGPKGVRTLLFFRGLAGYAPLRYAQSWDSFSFLP